MTINDLPDDEKQLINNIRLSKLEAYKNGLAGKPLSPLLPGIRSINSQEEENQIIENAIDAIQKESGVPKDQADIPLIRDLVRMVLVWQIEEYRKGAKAAIYSVQAPGGSRVEC